jgi:hypothetical protein
MPAMPRPSRKTKTIAYRILGVPPAMQDKKTPRDREIDKVVYRDQVQRQK